MYTDDIAISADDKMKAIVIFTTIPAQPFRLIMSMEKTNLLTTDGSPVVIQINGVWLKQVQEFQYWDSMGPN